MSVEIRPIWCQDQILDIIGGTLGFTQTMFAPAGMQQWQYYDSMDANVVTYPPVKLASWYTPDINQSYTTTFFRPTSAPGLFKDTIEYWALQYAAFQTPDTTSGLQDPTSPNVAGFSDYQSVVQYLGADIWQYYIFQKAVAVLLVDNASVVPGANFSKAANTDITIVNSSRGNELGSVYTVKIQNLDGSWSNAVLGQDYVFNPSSQSGFGATSTIQLTKAGTYRFTITANGYNSLNNPWVPRTYTSEETQITDNSDTVTFTINTGVPVPTETIVFPKIQTVVVPASVVSNTPLTAYQNGNITVSGTVLYDTGSWLFNGVPRTGVQTTEWDSEMTAKCKIKLYVRDASGIDAVPPKDGLGPHTFIIPKAGTYTINYITSLI